MPSAAAKSDVKPVFEGDSPIKAALIVVDKKVRNLEKRKGKLDGYREKYNNGETLNEDQKEAIDKYDSVIINLEFARDLQKQFMQIQAESEKMLKKQQKREKGEKQAQEARRMRELLHLQNVLDNMGSETVRQDFKEGKRGAVVLTDENLNHLDELFKLISPTREGETSYEKQLNEASEHIVNLLDAKDKPVLGTTYKALKELLSKIDGCGYFTNPPAEETADQQDNASEDSSGNSEEYVMVKTDEVPDQSSSEVRMTSLPQDSATHPPQTQQPPQAQQQGNGTNMVGISFYTETPSQEAMTAAVAAAAYQNQQRPFQEIVSSVQGTYDFLQESQIEPDSPHVDPAVVAAQPMVPKIPHPQSQTDGSLSSQSWGDQADHHSEQLQEQQQQQYFQSESTQPQKQTLQSQQQSSYDTSAYGSQGYDMMSQNAPSSYGGTGLEHTHMNLNDGDRTLPDVPPSIPLPNQTTLADQQADEKKTFTMNASAPVFQSMYTQAPAAHTESSSIATTVDSMGQQDMTSDYNSGGYSRNQFNGYGGRGGSRGGPRGGRGMNSGYRGGRGGPPFNSRGGFRGGRGGGESRGARGTYHGYPPRSNYRPEGYQGVNGYRGGPRGGSAGRGGRGNYGGKSNSYGGSTPPQVAA